MISLVGLFVGLVIGIGFALLQQHFGFIKMPGNFIVQAYPVILSAWDILITVAGVATIGYLIALLPVYIYRRHGLNPPQSIHSGTSELSGKKTAYFFQTVAQNIIMNCAPKVGHNVNGYER